MPGLRISEALSLTPNTAPLDGRDVMHIKGKGGKERLVPALAIVSERDREVHAALPVSAEPDGPLFLGARGGPLVAAPHSIGDGTDATRTRLA